MHRDVLDSKKKQFREEFMSELADPSKQYEISKKVVLETSRNKQNMLKNAFVNAENWTRTCQKI